MVVLENVQDTLERAKVVFPTVVENADVIKVDVGLFDLAKEIFHDGLRFIRGNFNTHWKAVIAIIAKRSADGAQILALIVQFECVILHRHIDFRKELITGSFRKDLGDLWQVIDLALLCTC